MSDQSGKSKGTSLMTIKEVADYLVIHEITLYTLLKETTLPAMKLGGQWRFQKALLDQWLVDEMNRQRLIEVDTKLRNGQKEQGNDQSQKGRSA